MELHKCLYKGVPAVLTPRQTKRQTREILNANRAKQRNDMYTSTRNISFSPSPERNREARISATSTPASYLRMPEPSGMDTTVTMTAPSLCVGDDKENITASQQMDKTELYESRIAKAACTRDPKKLSRQEAYLMRFIEWKEKHKEKEEKQKKKSAQLRPFVPAGKGGNTFAPKNHQFRAPDGLKNPAKEGPLAVKQSSSLRKSLYAAMQTPPRKPVQPDQPIKKKLPISQLALTQKRVITKKPPTTTATTFKTELKTVSHEKFQRKPPPISIPKPVKTQTAIRTATTTTFKPTVSTTKPKATPATTRSQTTAAKTVKPAKQTKKSPVATRIRARQLMPPPPPAAVKTARIAKPIRGGGGVPASSSGAIKKAKALQDKRDAAVASTAKVAHHQPPKLSVSMKAKKPIGSSRALARVATQGTSTLKRLYGMNLLNVPGSGLPILETPTEVAGKNPFAPTITSTSLKTDFEALLETSGLASEAAAEVQEKRTLSAKRELQLNEEPTNPTKSKFKFIRYSEANTECDMNDTPPLDKVVDDNANVVQNEAPNEEQEEDGCVTLVGTDNQVTDEVEQITPKRDENLDRPSYYLSPFVSVSRGKVNARTEKAKRNSLYLNDPTDDAVNVSPPRVGNGGDALNQPTTPVELRRTLETVLYFRKQLRDTIERLHAQCDQWDLYRDVNMQRLQETNGEDMINVTIGQTKLLTSKKFMQFKGLIDRCEAQARGEAAPDDGSEATKLITSVDLEGFWSMLGIQVDNLDKRFENLERWKANDWNDPDEVPAAAAAKPTVKVKKNLSKVKKPKAAVADTKKPKSSSALIQMMRKMQAEMRKNKAAAKEEDADDDAVVDTMSGNANVSVTSRGIDNGRPSTPNSSQRRTSYILVRDRKSFSIAPTVLRVTPQRSNPLQAHLNEFKNSLAKLEGAFELSSAGGDASLLKTALKGAEQKRRMSIVGAQSRVPPEAVCRTPVMARGRKSILKTPGTAKSHRKSVVFENRVKQLKFTINDTDDEDDVNDSDDCGGAKVYNNRNAEVYQELKKCDGGVGEDVAGEDNSGRMYSLRTRKVALRPSCEIIIPKKSL